MLAGLKFKWVKNGGNNRFIRSYPCLLQPPPTSVKGSEDARQLGLALYASFAEFHTCSTECAPFPLFHSQPFIPVLVSGRLTDLLTALPFLSILPMITL